MSNTIINFFKKLVPHSAAGVMAGLIGIIYLKFLLFDLIWAIDTTFSCFQFPLGYLSKLAFATLLALPMLGFKSKWYAYPLCFLIDLWLIANIMYARTLLRVHQPSPRVYRQPGWSHHVRG